MQNVITGGPGPVLCWRRWGFGKCIGLLGGGGNGGNSAGVTQAIPVFPIRAAAAVAAGGAGGAGGSGIVIVAYLDSSVTTYTVNFESNGGSPAPASQTVVSGNTATQPSAPTKPGSTFVEWCSDIGLATPFNFSTPITADTTLYAKWDTLYAVTFVSNGGSAVATQYVVPGNTATEPTAPIKTGYTFVDWFSDIDLTTAFYFSTPITADTPLYAKWVLDTVAYVHVGGPGTIGDTTLTPS